MKKSILPKFLAQTLPLICLAISACEDGRRRAEQALRDETDCPRKTKDALFLRGERVFARTCATCHKLSGDGQAGAFPPLRHHAGLLGSSAAGRRYLVRLLVWGQRGQLVVGGKTYNNIMPPQAPGVVNEDLAAVLTYTFGNCRQTSTQLPFSAAEIQLARAESKLEAIREMAKDRGEALRER